MIRDNDRPPMPDDPGPPAGSDGRGRPDLPESPDPERVRRLREQMRSSRSNESSHSNLLASRRDRNSKRNRARDLGAYTLIPMLMLAGPAVGYGVGLLAQRQWGGEPWGAVIGVLVGMVAGFRQVFLLVADIQKRNRDRDS